MKLWFAADIPSQSFGGVSRSMSELARGLKSRGHTVHIITGSPRAAGNYLVFAARLGFRFIRFFFSRPDWILARSTDAVFCALIIRLFRLNTGILLHNHGWEECVYDAEKRLPHSVLSNPTTWKSFVVRFPLLRLTLKTCTVCMSGTVHETRFLKAKYPALAHKLLYLPNGVTEQELAPWKNRDACPPDFLFVGNTTWKKNLLHAAGVFSYIKERHADARLFCVGTGLDDTALSGYIGCRCEGIVTIRSVPFEEMLHWYGRCPFMLAPSRYEGGHPLAILEAMASGVLVFASAIPSHTEILRNGVNGYCISGVDAEHDARYILEKLPLAVNRNIRARAVETAKRNRWQRQVSRLERVLCRNR